MPLRSSKQKMSNKIWKLCLVGINFRESAKRLFSREYNFANWGVIHEIRENFLEYITLRKLWIFGFGPKQQNKVPSKFEKWEKLIHTTAEILSKFGNPQN